VDLLDVAGFQNRFGFGVGPPKLDGVYVFSKDHSFAPPN
jgi:hypothetical protein